jgi:hypothetical protein
VVFVRRKWIGTVAAGVAAALEVSVLAVAPASAATTVVNCVGNMHSTYSPGLTNETRTHYVVGSDNATLCVSLTHPTLTSFVGPYSGSGEVSCNALLAPGAGTETLYWNGTTQFSTWSFDVSQTSGNGTRIVTATGPITSGVLAGTTLTQIAAFPNDQFLGCSTETGVEEFTGETTWAFTDI